MGCTTSQREPPPPSREPMGTGDNGDNGSLARSCSVCGGDDDSFDSRCGFQLPPKHMLHTEQTLNKVASSLTASTVFDPLQSRRSLCRFTCGVSGRLQLQVPLPPSPQQKSATPPAPAATPPPRLRAGKHHVMRRKAASVNAMLPAMRRLREAQAGSSQGARESAPASQTPSSPTSRGSTSAVVQTGEGLASFDACESVAAMSSAIEMVLGKAHCRHHVPAVLCEHPECVLGRNSPVRLAAVSPTIEAEDKDDDDASECFDLQDAQFSLRLAPSRADSFPTLDGAAGTVDG